MSSPFVWFHNSSQNPIGSAAFYEKLLGWKPADGPGGMTMFVGEKGPFAGVATNDGGASTWIPYVEVADVDAATKKALKHGAAVVREKSRGPAGDFCVVTDPGGAMLALWQKA